MRISTRGRYALRAMLDLAEHVEDSPVSRRKLAERQEISADYVAQLFRHLQAAGLVEGVKGPGGGYRLAREAALISAADVVQAVEGPFAVVQCTLAEQGDGPVCPRVDGCVTHLLWKQLSTVVAQFLDSVTLQDLADQAQGLAQVLCPSDQ